MNAQAAQDLRSLDSRHDLEVEKVRAEIQHMIAQQDRWRVEQEKMRAEREQAAASAKWCPRWVLAVIVGAACAICSALGTLLTLYLTEIAKRS